MLRVSIQQSRGGMVLCRPVPNPKAPEQMLLKAGFELDEEHIQKLSKHHISHVWVKYPGLDFLDEMLDPKLIEKQQAVYKTLKDCFTEVKDEGLNQINYNEYVQQMSAMFQHLLQSKSLSAHFVMEMQGESEDLFLHGTTVASLAMLIGLRMESYLVRSRPNLPATVATDLTQLGVGCLLHDIGKLQLPEEKRHFHITASDRGSPEWQRHTEAGLEMIRGGLDACAGQVVLNHHQHFDGSGFPMRKSLPGLDEPTIALSGEEIHIFCRIACLADRFEGFRHLPDGRTAPTVVALKRMKNPGYAKWFDPEIYRAFTEAMPAFSPGEQVQLNDGRLVVVTEVHTQQPCRPVVRPIDLEKAQAGGKTKEGEPEINLDIDLARRKDLSIAKVGDFDVTSYLH